MNGEIKIPNSSAKNTSATELFRVRTLFTGLMFAVAMTLGACQPAEVSEDGFANRNVVIVPGSIVIRDDGEFVRIEKSAVRIVTTSFSEFLTGVSIDVVSENSAGCRDGSVQCEDWRITNSYAIPGRYDIDVGLLGGDGHLDAATLNVLIAPRGRGSDAIRKVAVDESIRPTNHLALSENGRVWSWSNGIAPGINEALGRPDGAVVPREVQAPGFSDIVDIAAGSKLSLALQADGTVWQISHDGPGDERVPLRHTGIEALVQANAVNGTGATRVVAIEAPSVPSRGYRGPRGSMGLHEVDRPVFPFDDTIDAYVVLDDGTVASWGYDPDLSSELNAAAIPQLVPGLTDIVEISVLRTPYVLALRRDGQVLELGRISTGPTGSTVGILLDEPTLIPGISSAVAVSGRRALLADGSVMQWALSRELVANSQPVKIPGLNGVVSLPDPSQNIALLADGSMEGWRFGFEAPVATPAEPITGTNIGAIRSLSGNYAVDAACGRVWQFHPIRAGLDLRNNPASAALVDNPSSPVLQLGDASNCQAAGDSHVVVFYVTGSGHGSIQSDVGTVNCRNSLYGEYCWVRGDWANPPVFTAIPDVGSAFDSWRWDCLSSTPASRPVITRPATEENSQNLCKVVFTAIDEPVDSQQTLSITVVGAGTVTSSPAGINCGADCQESYDQATTVMLNAVPDTGNQFDAWSGDAACIGDPQNPGLNVTVSGSLSCTATFRLSDPVGMVPPVALFTYSPASPVTTGSIVTFDASTSSDADGTIVNYDWDLNSDAVIDAMGEVVTYVYASPGDFNPRLAIADNDGQVASTSGSISVVNPSQTVSLRVLLTGSGRVDVTPPGVSLPNNSDCDGSECFVFNITPGTMIAIDATAFTPASFLGWSTSECDVVAAERCTITLNSNRTITATFQ